MKINKGLFRLFLVIFVLNFWGILYYKLAHALSESNSFCYPSYPEPNLLCGYFMGLIILFGGTLGVGIILWNLKSLIFSPIFDWIIDGFIENSKEEIIKTEGELSLSKDKIYES